MCPDQPAQSPLRLWSSPHIDGIDVLLVEGQAHVPEPTVADGVAGPPTRAPFDPRRLSPWFERLTAVERARAARLRYEGDAWAFVVGRVLARQTLADRLDRDDGPGLPLNIGARGKPFLDTEPRVPFNISHTVQRTKSGWTALVAVAVGQPGGGAVGIDVERIARFERGTLADRYFAPGERAAIDRCPPEDRPSGLAALWTRKEAFLKATGEGIARGLDSFEVTLDLPPRLLRVDGDDASRWMVLEIDVPSGYRGALVVART
jgi:4'-phosphopantetheinyl transferase